MLQQFVAIFATTSIKKVIKLLRLHFKPVRISQIEKGEIKKNTFGVGFNFNVPPDEVPDFQEFLDCMDSRGVIEILKINDSGSANGSWYTVKIL